MDKFIGKIPRWQKAIFWLCVDALLIPFSLYIAFALRLGIDPQSHPVISQSWLLFPLLTLTGLILTYALGLPRLRLHSFDAFAMRRVGLAALGLTVTAVMISYMASLWAPRSVPLIFGMTFFLATVAVRLTALALLQVILNRRTDRVPAAIYGAGVAGIQLTSALVQSRQIRPVAFVDDNPALWGLLVSGLQVKPPSTLEEMITSGRIRQVLLAMPSISYARRMELTERLRALGAEVTVTPAYADLLTGRALTETDALSPDALLGRDKVDLDTPDVAKAYAGRTVMVTGAGGSIGAELCRQLASIAPAHIVLFERSEYALYQIERDLRSLPQSKGIKVTARLGSVIDPHRLSDVMRETGTEIVLHAAAYKHVPLVEENELEGARNNVLGTQAVAEAAREAGIERFILISTDKAVRPTNIMGATKRMSELVVQDLQTRSARTKFAMVRFGNVLGSSGSVLPLFESQIKRGGPVTVTHPAVTRYFMTIPEAARLVLLAGAYATGGDVFVLDMGEPMKIMDIARRMIDLSGRQVREMGPDGEMAGDIEIEITGLRPGEKLYEELLIDDASLRATPHEKILRAEEAMLSQIEVASMLKDLNAALNTSDKAALRALIEKRVEGYHRQEDLAL